jgi:thiol-disulfide isomerase/thioredoxin
VSRSPLDAQSQQPEEAYFAAWGELAERIRQGQSFSGRERNCCFLNTGGPRWADASSALGLDLLDDSRAVASVDWDQDGDLDLWLTNRTGPRVRYLRNDTPAGHAYLALQLRGDVRRRCPSDAIGARVELQLLDEEGRERRQVQTLVAGDGFLSQSSKQLHFGFPERWTLRHVLVRWPGSLEPETWTGLAKNGRYLLEQGQSVPAGGAAGDARPTPAAMLLGAEPRNVERWPADPMSSPAETDAARLWLSLAVLESEGAERARSRPVPLGSRPLLLSLWASWCQPCLQELQEWSQQSDALKATGIETLALNIDRLDPQAAEADETVRTLVARMQLPFTTGFASRELVERLESLRNEAIYRRTPLPLPVSFLVDRGGRAEPG